MIVTVEVLWSMNMTMFVSYCHDVILSTGCSIDDRDRGSVMANVANGYEIAYQLLSRRDSFDGLFD